MNTVEQVEQLIRVAESSGYEIRYECLDGAEGGFCEVGKRKILFLDLNQTAVDHLDLLKSVLKPPAEAQNALSRKDAA